MQRCFLLGAGFSKVCGLPLASELTRLVFNDAYPEGDDFLAPMRDLYLGFLRRLYPPCDFDRHWPDLEDLITVLDEWESYRRSCEGSESPGTAGTATHLKNVLLKHVATSLCALTTSAPRAGKELIAGFLRDVQRTSSTVVSFNWDLVLECAAHDAGIPVVYDGDDSAAIWLAKPHGSLNVAELDADEYNRLSDSINIYNLTKILQDAGTVVVRADDPSDAANRILHPFAKSQRVLVEPTARKVYSSAWIALQWRRALHAMRNADEIVIIGYSLPDTDFRPRILFQLAVWDRQRGPRIALIDPNADQVVARYRRFVGVPIVPIASTWGDWFAGQDV